MHKEQGEQHIPDGGTPAGVNFLSSLWSFFFFHRWWTSTSMLDLLTKWLGRPKQTLSHNSLSLEALLASSPDSLFSVASRSSISSSRSTFIFISSQRFHKPRQFNKISATDVVAKKLISTVNCSIPHPIGRSNPIHPFTSFQRCVLFHRWWQQ